MTPQVKAFRNGQDKGKSIEDPWVQLLNLDRGDQSFLWMKPDTARRLANALIDAADWLDGVRDSQRTFNVERQ